MKNVWKIFVGVVVSFLAVVGFYFRPNKPTKTGTPIADLDAIRAKQRDTTLSTGRSKRLNAELGEAIKLNVGENRSAKEGIERAIDLTKRDGELIKEAKGIIDSLK